MSLKPSSVSRWRAIRLRTKTASPVLIAWGMPCSDQSVGPMAALDVGVLDVVVDQAEVVAELDGRGAGQGRLVLAGDRGVGQQPEQRPHPLAGRAAAVEAEVVADHLVQAPGRRVVVADEAQDLVLGGGDQGGEIELWAGRGHRPASVHANLHAPGSGLALAPHAVRRADATVRPCP